MALPDGRMLLNFSSNDYLNLAHHPYVKEQAIRAIEQWGCSASGSRLMSGTLAIHEELEAALARLVGTETALVFASGFGMNVGLIAALASRDDLVFADRLNHASLVDGARLSGATVRRYAHNDAEALAKMMARSDCRGHRLLVCESVFSMDGDIAPLARLRELATAHDAALVVDEAHAIGVFGKGGGVARGLFHANAHGDGLMPAAIGGLAPAGEGASSAARSRNDEPLNDGRPDLTIGTLGKALGSLGGFVACSQEMRDLLVNRARSFIYSTALPPASCAAALAAVTCIEREPELGARLLDRAKAFHGMLVRRGLRLSPFETQIIPVPVGDNGLAVEFSRRLAQEGLLVTAVRPPTVPAGTARLRLSVTLAHEPADLERAADCIGRMAREVGLL